MLGLEATEQTSRKSFAYACLALVFVRQQSYTRITTSISAQICDSKLWFAYNRLYAYVDDD